MSSVWSFLRFECRANFAASWVISRKRYSRSAARTVATSSDKSETPHAYWVESHTAKQHCSSLVLSYLLYTSCRKRNDGSLPLQRLRPYLFPKQTCYQENKEQKNETNMEISDHHQSFNSSNGQEYKFHMISPRGNQQSISTLIPNRRFSRASSELWKDCLSHSFCVVDCENGVRGAYIFLNVKNANYERGVGVKRCGCFGFCATKFLCETLLWHG